MTVQIQTHTIHTQRDQYIQDTGVGLMSSKLKHENDSLFFKKEDLCEFSDIVRREESSLKERRDK